MGQRARLGTGTALIVRPRASHPARSIADHEWPRRCAAFARSADYESNLHPANAPALSPSDRCGGAQRFLAALATDEEQERKVGLLLLGKGAVLAHGLDRPLAIEMDE